MYKVKTYDPPSEEEFAEYGAAFDAAWNKALAQGCTVRLLDDEGEVIAYFDKSDVAGAVDVDYGDI